MTMIFEVNASQIERLDANQVVELLRKLVHAELLKYKIPLRSASVHARINIADGGEDGRVSWAGGPNQTDWLPSRFSVFQCKRGAISPSELKKETWTKASQKRKPELNEALTQAIALSGSYTVVTTTAIAGTKRDPRIEAIRKGIQEAGHDPKCLTSIDIYDCNRLADWTNTHPAVALWLNTLLRDVYLGGFQTHEDWSRTPDISKVPYKNSKEPRYLPKGSEIRTWKNQEPGITEEKDLAGIRQLIVKFFRDRGNALRVTGPSGFGKTRFVHELINIKPDPDDALDKNQIIFCNYADVRDRVINLARELADSGSGALLIVDDCPDSIHMRLSEAANRQGSNCAVITIGVESKAESMHNNLVVQLSPASDEHIVEIASAVHPEAKGQNATFVRELSQGFPQMAIFAARALQDGDFELNSVEAFVSRIVGSENAKDPSALKSLQLISLFTLVGVEGSVENELAEIAEFANKEQSQIFDEISRFVDRGVIHRQGDYAEVQPLPLAMRLANMWMKSVPIGTLATLFRSLSEDMKLRMVRRLRWLSWSDEVKDFAETLISEALPSEIEIKTEFGSKLLDRFVHLAPDVTMDHMQGLLGGKSVDELLLLEDCRDDILWALEKLVRRRQTFIPAAQLLLKLGTAENEACANNATEQFTNLYQLCLSGTEATPDEKLIVLDQGLSHDDTRVRAICLAALEKMLDIDHCSRFGGSENIGADKALKDWEPETDDQITDYYRQALKRLEDIALGDNQEDAQTALNSIGSHLRGLLGIPPLLEEVKALISRLLQRYPYWTKPLMAVNKWLYYDRKDAPNRYQDVLRAYYDKLLPESDLELLQFYSAGWTTDINDPDIPYSLDSLVSDNDFDYSTNQIVKIVARSPKEADYFLPILDTFMDRNFNSCQMTVEKIAAHVSAPLQLMEYLTGNEPSTAEAHKIADLANSIIAGARQSNREVALQCLDRALEIEKLEPFAASFIATTGLDNTLMSRLIQYVDGGKVEPIQTNSLASPDILKDIDPELIVKLINIMCGKGSAGVWSSVGFLARIPYKKNLETDTFAPTVKCVVTALALFKQEPNSNANWHHWHNILEKMITGGHTDRKFLDEVLTFILSVTKVREFNIQLAFDHYARKILRQLISVDPELVWNKFHEYHASSDGTDNYRLENLFEFGNGNLASAGVLNDVPIDIRVSCMLKDKSDRLPFILKWIELFTGEEDHREWSQSFINFTDQYIDIDDADDLNIITSRLISGIWRGSYANKLEREREQLIKLKEISSNPIVRSWVDRVVSRFNSAIVAERRQDANRDAKLRL